MELLPSIGFFVGAIHVIRKTLETGRHLPEWDRILSRLWMPSLVVFGLAQLPFLRFLEHWYEPLMYLVLLFTIYLLREHRAARLLALALIPFAVVFFVKNLISYFTGEVFDILEKAEVFTVLWLLGFGIYASVQNNKERKTRQKEEAEKQLAEARKAELERLVVERTTELTTRKEELEKTLAELQAAQAQLVHSEKMASLGELTAGIAHEIQNPLNFVNNFSELSVELARELVEELEKHEPDSELVKDLLSDLTQNQEKINHHGKRAANIVSSMLQHARTSTGKKEPTDINALADEYLRLSYHGLRAKDKSFNAKMLAELDPAVGKVDVIPQDMGRVLLNLINNAFYAVQQKKQQVAEADAGSKYDPTVTVSTRSLPGGKVEIRIRDNGTGIPESLKSRIFQPFFTTKPTGQGTGLGLSLAFDIVTKGHGGAMSVETAEGEGTTFIITI